MTFVEKLRREAKVLVEDQMGNSAAKEQERKERRENRLRGDLKSLESIVKVFHEIGLSEKVSLQETTKFRLSLARKLPVMFMEIKFVH